MRKILLASITLIACVDGKAGPKGSPGDPGAPGPMGPPGEALVWKDASGAMVENAYPAFHDHTLTMLVRNTEGVVFELSPLGGTPMYAVLNSNAMSHYHLTTNCAGPSHLAIPVAPGVAFKYDGRIVALPADVAVVTTVGSIETSYSGCYTSSTQGEFVQTSTLDALPTIVPPLVAPGPYHLEPL